jgi:hypothetical protein
MFRKALEVISLFCLGMVLQLTVGRTFAQSNMVLLVSQPGDLVGGGSTYMTANANEFTVAVTDMGLEVTVPDLGFSIWADGPNGAPLAVGNYPNAARDPFNGDSPGLDIDRKGFGCNTVCGSFQISEWETDTNGNLLQLAMTFTQYCECFPAPLTGEIRYQSRLAPAGPPRVLRVPGDYPTIQGAIEAANYVSGDTVLVSDGTYFENLDFLGKGVTVTSVNGPQVTVIDGGQSTVVNFSSGESSNSILNGFTLTNAMAGAGANVYNSSPLICSNTIVDCAMAVYSELGSPWVLGNYISGSADLAVQFGGGGGPVLQGNTLVTNEEGGVYIGDGVSAIIADNLIQGNGGDGITIARGASPAIVQNIILENYGNGISADDSWVNPGLYVINNTIAGNGGSGITVDTLECNGLVANNIISGTPALVIGNYCWYYGSPPPPIEANDIYSPGGDVFAGGAITNLIQIPGNISTDPWFACEPEGDFHLAAGSSCIDAGANSAGDLPATDFDGNPRMLAGISNDVPTVDMGAYEFNPLNPPIPCMFLDCLTDMVVYAAPGQNSSLVSFPTPTATPSAKVVFVPASGSTFYGGTNVVTCTATYGTNSESCVFNVIVLVAPVITQQPRSLQISAGESFTLSVEVAVTSLIAYQWSFEGNPIAGATGANLTVSDAQAAAEGVYSVAIANGAGSTNSSLARVRVLPAPPAIALNPVSVTVPAGTNVTFSVTTTGSEPLSYQWYFNTRAMARATTAQCDLANVQLNDAGSYYVVVKNRLGKVTSKTGQLAVRASRPIFVEQPLATWAAAGWSAVFSAMAEGSAPIHYQWYFNGQPMRNQTNASLILPVVKGDMAGNYYLVAGNSYGTARSTIAELTVVSLPWGR